jgi:hypothetical protein
VNSLPTLRLLKALARGQQDQSDADSLKLEAPLSLIEIQKAMYSKARGKIPGPDGLGAEFYHAFGPFISPPLNHMLLEAQSKGVLPEEFASGNISVLYKKGDPRDVLNYRPMPNHTTSSRL